MKKSVIIIIGVIYIASIALIGFFGMQIKSFDEIIYVNEIKCQNENLEKLENGEKVIYVVYDEYASAEENVFQLQWKVYPEIATNKRVNFEYKRDSAIGRVDEAGRVYLTGQLGLLLISIKSTDGSNIKETINLVVVDQLY